MARAAGVLSRHAGCVEEFLKIKAEMAPQRYDEMIQCKLAARDVPTYSKCGLDPEKRPAAPKDRGARQPAGS